MFVAGLSGETRRLVHPRTGEAMILRKALQRDYIVRGDMLAQVREPAEFVEETWVMR